MATKTANILARVEPETKQKAEEILDQLGIPASVVINMLYKQIILTNSIPFSISIPSAPLARDEMDDAAFRQKILNSYDQIRSGKVYAAEEIFDELGKGL